MEHTIKDILKDLADGKTVYGDDARVMNTLALKCEALCREFNALPSYSEEGRNVLKRLFERNVPSSVVVRPPFTCDYGLNIVLDDGVFINYGAHFLDACEIRIGAGTMVGPNVHIYSADHPLDPEERRKFACNGKPVKIGKNVWIGGNCTILPGVVIGDDSVIGAGSVVTKNVEPRSIVAGNPAKFLRKL